MTTIPNPQALPLSTAGAMGSSILFDGDTLIAGCPGSTIQAHASTPYCQSAGDVRQFKKDEYGTWQLVGGLRAAAPTTGASFGFSMAMDGDTLAVGAPGETTASNVQSGAVYIFKREGDSWTQTQRISNPTSSQWDAFGYSLAMQGDVLLVGAPGYDNPVPGPFYSVGIVYVYNRIGGFWLLVDQLEPPTSTESVLFGSSVALDGATAVVGAPHLLEIPFPGTAMTPPGIASVFEMDGTGWHEAQVLTSSAGNNTDMYGYSVSIMEDRIAIGARYDTQNGLSRSGAAYVYSRSGEAWIEEAIIAGQNEGARLGDSVTLRGNELLVTEDKPYLPLEISARIRIYARSESTWTEQSSAEIPTGAGAELAYDGNTVAVWAGSEYGDPTGAGRITLFEKSGTDILFNARFDGSLTVPKETFAIFAALDGDTAVVSATTPLPTGDRPNLLARVYRRTGEQWIEQQALYADLQLTDLNFPYLSQVAISGNRIIVMASGHLGHDPANRFFIFDYSQGSWELSQLEFATDNNGSRSFGTDFKFEGNTVIVSSPLNNDGAPGSGAVFVFREGPGGWAFQQMLKQPTPVQGSQFGTSIAIDHGTILVGAPFEGRGVVYEFTESDGVWIQHTPLVPTPITASLFGASVAIQGDRVAVGVPADRVGSSINEGSVYTYVRDGDVWRFHEVLHPAHPLQNGLFGECVAIGESLLFVRSQLAPPLATAYWGVATFIDHGNGWNEIPQPPFAVAQSRAALGERIILSGQNFLITEWSFISEANSDGAIYLGTYDPRASASEDWLLLE